MGGPSPPAPMYIRVPFHFNPIRELEWMIRALGIFKRNDANQGEGTRYLYMAGPSSWEVVDIMEDRCGRKPSPLISA